MIEALAGFAAMPEAGITGDHLRDHQAGTQFPAHAAEWAICYTGHGSQDHAAGQLIGSDADHCMSIPVLVGQWCAPQNRRTCSGRVRNVKRAAIIPATDDHIKTVWLIFDQWID